MNNPNTKRQEYLTWDETFMQMSRLIAKRSKDPNTQNGACLVDENNIVIGLGYNGFPRNCSDNDLPWSREGGFLEKKYAYVVHAEANAILNSNKCVKGAKLYCTLFPCNECTKIAIQSGISEIIYESDKYHDMNEWVASRKMLELAGIKYRQYAPIYNLEISKKQAQLNFENPPIVKDNDYKNEEIKIKPEIIHTETEITIEKTEITTEEINDEKLSPDDIQLPEIQINPIQTESAPESPINNDKIIFEEIPI